MKLTTTAVLSALAAVTMSCDSTHERPTYAPVVVMSAYRLGGVVVRGPGRDWWKLARTVRYGDPLPVGVTMYCLRGTTRRGRYVRSGIVAADPKLFPLAQFIELYVGRHYLGRFLVDDTGLMIRGPRIDVWTGNCREARLFGLQRGTAVLVPRPPAPRQAGVARNPTSRDKAARRLP